MSVWEPDGPIAPADRAAWEQAARRIAPGLRELAHLPAAVDPDLCVLAVPVDGLGAAARWSDGVASENVEARVVVNGAGVAGVQLLCRPHAPDEEIRHVVLACVKAAHAPGEPTGPRDVAAQLDAMFAVERIVGGAAARLRAVGASIGGAVGGKRLP